MADPSSSDDDRAAARHDGPAPPGMPRWVKVLALALVVLVVLAGGLMVLAGDDHGPGRHAQGEPIQLVATAEA